MKEGKKEERTDYKKTKNSIIKQFEIVTNTDIIKKYENINLEKDEGFR
jgi:hypothetical protein